MRPVKRHLIAAVLCPVLFASGPVLAHSLESLQQELFKQEKYFQIKDEPAPEFALRDAAGDPVRLENLHGKVIVLHFIYAGCPDVCPLHAERIGEIQEMVNIAPMRDLVQFVTITTDPVRDGPEVMAGYGPPHGLDPANWVFLTSAPDQPEDATRATRRRVRPSLHADGRWLTRFTVSSRTSSIRTAGGSPTSTASSSIRPTSPCSSMASSTIPTGRARPRTIRCGPWFRSLF